MARRAENDEAPTAWDPRAAGEEKATSLILEMQRVLAPQRSPCELRQSTLRRS